MGLGALQPGHLIVVLVIVLLVFGPGKLPQLGKAVGDGLRELKNATRGEDNAQAATGSGSVTPMSATRTCANCRGSVTTADKFCGHCGAALEALTRSA